MKDTSLRDFDLNEQLNALRSAAAESRDPWLKAKYIALSDNRVRAAVLEKLQGGHTFQGIAEADETSHIDEKRVRFDFEHHNSEAHDQVKPSFLVVVNLAEGNITAIVDPHRSMD